MVAGRTVDCGYIVGVILVLFNLVQLLRTSKLAAHDLVGQLGALGVEAEQTKSSTTRRCDETTASGEVWLFEQRLFGALVQLFDIMRHAVEVTEDLRWWTGARLDLSIRGVRAEQPGLGSSRRPRADDDHRTDVQVSRTRGVGCN